MIRHRSWLLGLGLSVGSLALIQGGRVERREITVEVHEAGELSFDLSPDGSWIILGVLGQLWSLPIDGGDAVALTDAVRDTAEAHDPRWSPDGTRVVFWRGHTREWGVSPLWVLAIDSRRVHALVADTVQLLDPAWHPNGQTLAVVRSPSSRARPDDRLYRYDLATGALTPVAAHGLPANPARRLGAPAWSPDGRTIAVVDGAADGPIWEVDLATGDAVRLTPDGVQARQPVYSPDRTSIAYVAPDSGGHAQLWVQQRGTAGRRQLTATDDRAERLTTSFGRVAWTPNGQRLVFGRSGRLWSIPRAGGPSVEIPFTLRVRFTQARRELPPLRFPAQGIEQRARGFTGLALAPDADRVALIALDSLWIVTLDGRARSIAHVYPNASALAWSPDGTTLAWSAGRNGAEDLYATEIATGATRQLSALPGQESRPAWSPDGTRLVFLHAEPRGNATVRRIRVLHVDGAPVERADQTIDLGPSPAGSGQFTPLDVIPQWSRDGSSVFVAAFGGRVIVVPLQGERRTLRLPPAASSVRWTSDDSVLLLREDRLYTVPVSFDSAAVADGRLVTEDPALYPAVARDGTVLYVSTDGLRLRRPNGVTIRLGWPLRFHVPVSPPLLIRNVRVISGSARSPGALSDIRVARGRIERITPAGTVPAAAGAQVIDAAERFVIPGLIDLHAHPADEAQLRGALYFGITTIRDLGDPISRAAAWRDAVAAGTMAGPRLVLAGFEFVPGCLAFGGGWCLFTEFVQQPSDDSAAMRGLALAQAFGTGVVKLYQPLSLSGARRFIELAHRLGFRVTGHYGHNLPLLASAMDGEEHTGLFGPVYGDIAALAHAAGVAITPTLTPVPWAITVVSDTAIFSTPELAPFMDPATRQFFRGPAFQASSRPVYIQQNHDHRATVRRLHDAGVTVGTGTDMSALPWGVHVELEELVASGFTPAEALAAATSTAAWILGAEQEMGAIAPGRIADFVILDADPLADIRNTRSIWAVVQGGRVVDRGRLRQP